MQLPKLLSKTKILRGYQCLKSIYLSVHHKDLEPPVGPELQKIFDQGIAVGKEAQKRFPQAVLVDNPAWDFFGALKRTRELLKAETPAIFEAAFEYKGCFARADIIIYNTDSKRWSIYEVKSTTKLKDEHYDDIGLQAWIMANSGLPIEKICIMHLNSECRYPDLSNLFIEQDITQELRERHTGISNKLNSIFNCLRQDHIPNIDIGSHCMQPNPCVFYEHCWQEKKIPEISIFSIPTLREKKWELYNNGIIDIYDTKLNDSSAFNLNDMQARFIQILRSKGRWIDSAKVQQALSAWKFPMLFLDFETINPAIPIYKQTGPYTQTCFQFSAHLARSKQDLIDLKNIEHKEYLHTESTDPRLALVEKLILSAEGAESIVAYYGVFESKRIEELEIIFPQYEKQLKAMREKIVDPLPIFRESIYDWQFADSYSLKSVAPAILGELSSYANMQVGNGSEAQMAFEKIQNWNLLLQQNPEKAAKQKDEIQSLKDALIEYCKKDTFVMLELVRWLYLQN